MEQKNTPFRPGESVLSQGVQTTKMRLEIWGFFSLKIRATEGK